MGVPNGYTSAQVVQAVPTGIQSALVLIKTQTIGSAVATVTVSDVFSATYDNYKIILSGGVASDTSSINVILGATTTGYYAGFARSNYSNGAYDGNNNNNSANWSNCGEFTTGGSNLNMDLRQPFNTTRTTMSVGYGSVRTSGFGLAGGGFLDDATSYTAFTISTPSVTMTGGVIRVYGYLNS